MALVALAYRFPATIEIDFGSPLEGALGSSGFHDAEGSYRWSRARSEIVFPDPGARNPVRLELVLSGFRPPGSEPPLVAIEAEGRYAFDRPLPPRRDVLPRDFDRRPLELVLANPDSIGHLRSWSGRRPIARCAGPPRASRPRWAGVASPEADPGLGCRRRSSRALDRRPSVAPLSGRSSGSVFSSSVSRPRSSLRLWPSSGFCSRSGRGSSPPSSAALSIGRAVSRGPFSTELGLFAAARSFRSPRSWPSRPSAAFALRPRFELELGTGLPEPLLHRFAGFDRDEKGVVVRRTLPGASIDLRDFGAGAPWKVSIDASEARSAEGSICRAPPMGLSIRSRPPLPRVAGEMRISSLSIDRGRSLPPLRVVGLVLVSWALFAGAFGACGLSPRTALSLGSALSGLTVVGNRGLPGVLHPASRPHHARRLGLAPRRSRGLRSISRKVSQGDALAIATGAFALWFLATASPLYSGGHFDYHTSVAEEIWGGKFFLYYFPGPDNMLSHQPQWGNMTVPHPSLYHTVTAPLALLPRALVPPRDEALSGVSPRGDNAHRFRGRPRCGRDHGFRWGAGFRLCRRRGGGVSHLVAAPRFGPPDDDFRELRRRGGPRLRRSRDDPAR